MFYPVHINLQNRKCLVVGGGTVAERKVVAMLISGGEVTVISPDTTNLLTHLGDRGTIRFLRREFQAGDTNGNYLVCAATDITSINTAVYKEAHEKNKIALVNVVDVIPQCTFAAASVITDGQVLISISTSGKSPATSRRIREYFEEELKVSSLYTLGYENGEPVPVVNRELPYPVYLLLENRKCVLLYDNHTSEIERRVSLLQKCGANVKCLNFSKITPKDFDNAFMVILETHSSINNIGKNEGEFIYEFLNNPSRGSHFTPNLVLDENLILSISATNSEGVEKAEKLHRQFVEQFKNKGYGKFIDFLGSLRPAVSETLSTSMDRANYFDNLINHVETNGSIINANTSEVNDAEKTPNVCCLRLKNPDCTAECVFNWVLHGQMNKATELSSILLRN